MGSSTSQIEIAATREAVWAVLEDVRTLPELSKGTVEVKAPERLRSVGDTFEQTVELGGRRFTSTWEVLEIEPGERLVIEGSVLPGTKYRMTEELEDVGDGDEPCTRFALTMDYKLPFGPLGRLAARLGVERRASAEAGEVLQGVAKLATGAAASGDR